MRFFGLKEISSHPTRRAIFKGNSPKVSTSTRRYVYIWVDGIYFTVRLEPDRPCVLVVIGATKDGRKELIAIEEGHRASKLAWQGAFHDLNARGL